MRKFAIIFIVTLIFLAGAAWGQEDFEHVSSTLFHDHYLTTVKCGNYVFCQGQNGLQIIDVQDPSDPILVKNIANREFGRIADYSQPIDSLLYTFYGHFFKVYNISDTLNPGLIGHYETDFGNIGNAYIMGNTAYLITDSLYSYGRYFVRAIDLSNPANPELLSTLGFYYHLSLFPSGDLLYIIYTYDFNPNGMYIYDVSEPENPILLSDTDFVYFLPYDIGILDNFAIIVGEYGMLIVYISDPDNPEIVTTIDNYFSLDYILIEDDIAYMSTWSYDLPSNYIYSFDISDPVAPEFLGEFDMTEPLTKMFVENSSVFYIESNGNFNYTSTFNIVDFSDPYNPSLTGRHIVPGAIRDVQLYENYAFVATDYPGLQVIDIGDPFNPVLGEYLVTPDKAEDIVIRGDYAYLANYESGFLIFDISVPEAPVQTGSFEANESVSKIAVDGDRAYLISIHDLIILNIADPYNPYQIGIYGNFRPRSLNVLDNIAFILYYDEFEIVNMFDPQNPVLLSSIPFEDYCYNLDLGDTLAYITCGDNGLKILSVSDPTNPALIGEYSMESAGGVTAYENYVYLWTFFDAHLELIDTTDPTNPVFIAEYNDAESIKSVYARHPYIYIAAEEHLLILQLTETGIEEVSKLPRTFALCQNYPNPFNAATTIRYDLPRQSEVVIEIYDLLGRKLETLAAGLQPTGSHSIVWDAEDVSSGVYFYRIEAGDYQETRKCVLMK